MNPFPSHARNQENFLAFHALQGEFVRCLSRHPSVVGSWLDGLPARHWRGAPPPPAAPKQRAWRTARLSDARRGELRELVRAAAGSPAALDPLADWLLAALPVCTYLEIAASARPSLRAVDASADDLCRQLQRMREALFMDNYPLAQMAARQRNLSDPSEFVTAASQGLLDAVDRYVPGDRAARFGFFATFWIRYQMGRYTQKNGALVSFPMSQHRLGVRIERYRQDRQARGLADPTDAQICADLKLGPDAFYWHHFKPQVYSIETLLTGEARAGSNENYLADPSPGPAETLELAEAAEEIASAIRAGAPPAIRVMLAYARNIGSLAEAAGDYLADLHQSAMARLAPPPRAGLSGSPACGTACGPAFPERRGAGSP